MIAVLFKRGNKGKHFSFCHDEGIWNFGGVELGEGIVLGFRERKSPANEGVCAGLGSHNESDDRKEDRNDDADGKFAMAGIRECLGHIALRGLAGDVLHGGRAEFGREGFA